MDFYIQRERQWTVHPLSERARAWMVANYSTTRPLVRPATEGRMIVAALKGEDFLVNEEPPLGGDYDDFYSALLIARRKRELGQVHEALVDLSRVQQGIMAATEPKARRLLPLVDEELAAVAEAMRRTQPPPRRPTTPGPKALTWLQMADRFDRIILRIAISIVLTIDLIEFVTH